MAPCLLARTNGAILLKTLLDMKKTLLLKKSSKMRKREKSGFNIGVEKVEGKAFNIKIKQNAKPLPSQCNAM